MRHAIFFVFALFFAAPAWAQSSVVVNGAALSQAEVITLAHAAGARPIPGRDWYDARCGAWGVEGGPSAGVLPAGMRLGGVLKANASRGTSGVFVNGRQLTRFEVRQLAQLGPVYRGRYWLDARGNYGVEGGPALGKLVAAANQASAPRRQAQQRRGNATHWRSKNTDVGVGTDGNGGVYIMGADFSYSSF